MQISITVLCLLASSLLEVLQAYPGKLNQMPESPTITLISRGNNPKTGGLVDETEIVKKHGTNEADEPVNLADRWNKFADVNGRISVEKGRDVLPAKTPEESPQNRHIECSSSSNIQLIQKAMRPRSRIEVQPHDGSQKRSKRHHRHKRRNVLSVVKGKDATIPCVPESMKTEGLVDLAVDYIWTNGKGEELLNARFSKNGEGHLKISDPVISDSGKYKCKAAVPQIDSSEVTQQVFEHELLVYELAGHQYTTRLTLKLGKQDKKSLNAELLDLLQTKVCRDNSLCKPVDVHTNRCYKRNKEPECEYSINYKALDLVPEETCDKKCVEQKLLEQLDKAKRLLVETLTRLAQEENQTINPKLSSVKTKHLITCNPGMYILQPRKLLCLPCKPGTHSEANSSICSLCDNKHYQEDYGKSDCKACPEGKETDNMGADSKDECAEKTNPVLDTVKDLFFMGLGRR